MKNVARVNPKGYVVMVRARHAFDFTEKGLDIRLRRQDGGLDKRRCQPRLV
jgi:hypothetical protein